MEFADSDLRQRYPATVSSCENAWERFIPFLEFPPELRRIIYTTKAIARGEEGRVAGEVDVADFPCRRAGPA